MSGLVPAMPCHGDGWPHKLRHQQGLRLERGEVLAIDHRLYAVVGFDGRNEGYICWASDQEGGFDTNLYVIIAKGKAHGAPRELFAKVPPLPALDHTGRIYQGTPRRGRIGEEGPLLHAHAQGAWQQAPLHSQSWTPPYPSNPASARTTPPPTPPCEARRFTSEPSSAAVARPPWAMHHADPWQPSVGRRPPWQAAEAGYNLETPTIWSRVASSNGGYAEDLGPQADLAKTKTCVVCVVLRLLAASLSEALVRFNLTLRRAVAVPGRKTHGLSDAPSPGGSPRAERVTITTLADLRAAEAAASSRGPLLRQNSEHSMYGEVAVRPAPRRSDALEDLKITIPIVKPPSWREVQALIDQRAVTFDERGVKETMTVRAHRWSAFVDRQREKIQAEVCEARRRFLAMSPAMASAATSEYCASEVGQPEDASPAMAPDAHLREGPPDASPFASPRREASPFASPRPEAASPRGSEAPSGLMSVAESVAESAADPSVQAEAELEEPARDLYCEDDIAELEQMVERMEDWKDLARYSGESISMASTRCGNEMKIHVMAFAERSDGGGVDFMRLSYKKSVEVRDQCPFTRASPMQLLLGGALHSVFPSLQPPSSGQPQANLKRERWIQLLQRPDVAKYTIALAFRRALEQDGIRLQFCEGRLDDADAA